MHLLIEFAGNYGKWKEISDEDWKELAEAVPGFPQERTDYLYGEYLLTHENSKIIAKHNLEFHISTKEANQGTGQMLVKLSERIKSLELRADNTAAMINAGAMVQIHVPDFCLMQINDVTYLSDACTDDLQSHLNEGWRILAVCPPNGARRPDYILGRRFTSDE